MIATRGKYHHARVCITAWQVGALPEDALALGAATGALHFAGEATSFEHPGYVHGAYETGRRAALEILAQLVRE